MDREEWLVRELSAMELQSYLNEKAELGWRTMWVYQQPQPSGRLMYLVISLKPANDRGFM